MFETRTRVEPPVYGTHSAYDALRAAASLGVRLASESGPSSTENSVNGWDPARPECNNCELFQLACRSEGAFSVGAVVNYTRQKCGGDLPVL